MTETKQPTMAEFLRQLSEFLREGKEDDAKRLLVRVEGLLSARDDANRGTEHYCAVGGCINILQYAIKMDPKSADAADELGWTPLMIASSAGKSAIVRYLLSLPQVNVNTKNKNGQTSLHYAASKNHAEIVHLLMEHGADVNPADRYGHTPLHRAASQGHQKIVNMLLGQDKIRVDIRDSEGNTPLFVACEEDREDIAIALVMKGASLTTENREKKTPLDMVKTSTLRTKLKRAEERAQAKEN